MAKVGIPSPNAAPFRGALAQAIKVKFFEPTLVGLNQQEVVAQTVASLAFAMKETINKLEMLFDHFNIARSGNLAADYQSLSLSLALKFVPGFQWISDEEGKGRGRPVRDALIFIRLLADLEVAKRQLKITQQSKPSDARALKILTIQAPFSRRWARYRGKELTLANLLSEARNPKNNPLYRLWMLEGEALDGLVDNFSITKKAL